jgi:hypothetical protein
MRSGWSCPTIYGPNGDPYAAENNGFDTAVGKWYRVCVKNPWREATATVTAKSTGSDTGTATTSTDTRTATTSTDTRTATTSTSSQSETRTVAVAAIAAIANPDSRTVTAGNLLKTYSPAEKESLLDVTLKSTKSALINVSTDIPKVNLTLTAVKKNAPSFTFKVVTDADGDALVKTSKNLNGYTVTLIAGKVKLDSDLVKK